MRYSVEYARLIDADAKMLQRLVCDLQKWPSWSPWLCLDPDTQVQYRNGNRVMRWQSRVIGEGEVEITDNTENSQAVQLHFFKPFKSKAVASLHWYDEAGKQRVTWDMQGNMPWHLFFLVKTMKGWIRMDYRRGLQRLAYMAKTGKIPAKLLLQRGIVHKPAFHFVGIERKNVLFDALAGTMQQDAEMIFQHVKKTADDRFICLYDKVSVAHDSFDYVVGLATSRQLERPDGKGWMKRHIGAHTVMRVQLDGPYEFLGDAWSMAMMSIKPSDYKQNKRIPPYEVYEKSPENTKNEEKYRTYIDVPVAG